MLHVEVSEKLAKGLEDTKIAAMSLEESRVIVTYDEFRTEFDAADDHAVLLSGDQKRSARQMADSIHEGSCDDGDDLRDLTTVWRSWLD